MWRRLEFRRGLTATWDRCYTTPLLLFFLFSLSSQVLFPLEFIPSTLFSFLTKKIYVLVVGMAEKPEENKEYLFKPKPLWQGRCMSNKTGKYRNNETQCDLISGLQNERNCHRCEELRARFANQSGENEISSTSQELEPPTRHKKKQKISED